MLASITSNNATAPGSDIERQGLLSGIVATLFIGLSVNVRAMANGCVATEAEPLPDLVFGVGKSGSAVSHTHYFLERGQSYRLRIASGGLPQEVSSPAFFPFLLVRRITVDGIEIKTAGIDGFVLGDGGEVEVEFVPLLRGKYDVVGRDPDGSECSAEVVVR